MTNKIYATFLLSVMLLASSHASAMRCATKIIHEGDPQARVFALCGEPYYVNEYTKEVTVNKYYSGHKAGKIKKTVFVEEWTYNFGPNRFIQVLTFHNGKLIDIATGGKGYR